MFSDLFWRFVVRHWPLRKGRGRVYRAAWRRLRGTEILHDDFGNRLQLDLDQFIDAHIALDGAFEKEEIELLRSMTRERGCTAFIDVGANIGIYSLTLAAERQIREVFSFEPDPQNFERLAANAALNPQGSKLKLFPFALSSQAGESELFISRARKDCDWNKLNQGTSSLAENPARHTESIRIQTRPLDALLSLKGESVAIKIDVEGHEAEALEGMRRILRENRCLIQIEIFPRNFEKVDSILRGLGYEPVANAGIAGDNHIYAKRGV